jgi:hypothetical protein
MQARVEPKQGWHRDDTALNGIKIRCRYKNWAPAGEFEVNLGEHGNWESWSKERNHAGFFMAGARVKMGKKEAKDKTGANGLKIRTQRMFYKDGTNVIQPNWKLYKSSNMGIEVEIEQSATQTSTSSSSKESSLEWSASMSKSYVVDVELSTTGSKSV